MRINEVPQTELMKLSVLKTVFSQQEITGEQETPSAEAPRSIAESPAKALNIFFSNFSETDFNTYENEKYNSKQLIDFAILHNYINSDRVQSDQNTFTLTDEYVTSTVQKHFGKNIRNQTTDLYQYGDGLYSWPAATGGQFWNFTQVENLYEVKDATLPA